MLKTLLLFTPFLGYYPAIETLIDVCRFLYCLLIQFYLTVPFFNYIFICRFHIN